MAQFQWGVEELVYIHNLPMAMNSFGYTCYFYNKYVFGFEVGESLK